MTLEFRLEGDVLEVTERVSTPSETRIRYWYYNINTWRVSSFGKKNDPTDRDMTPASVVWVKKHYLPRAQQAGVPSPEPHNNTINKHQGNQHEAV